MTYARRRKGRGQALVEFAVALPVFLALVLATLDMGRVVLANQVVANASREGARYASVHGATPPGCDGTAQRPCATTTASKANIISYTIAQAPAVGASVSVTVCYSAVSVQSANDACSGNADAPGAQNSRGSLVTVTVSSEVPLITGALIGWRTFNINSTSTMLVNN